MVHLFLMRGVTILIIRDGLIAEGRLYVEPVEDAGEDIDTAVRELYKPPSADEPRLVGRPIARADDPHVADEPGVVKIDRPAARPNGPSSYERGAVARHVADRDTPASI